MVKCTCFHKAFRSATKNLSKQPALHLSDIKATGVLFLLGSSQIFFYHLSFLSLQRHKAEHSTETMFREQTSYREEQTCRLSRVFFNLQITNHFHFYWYFPLPWQLRDILSCTQTGNLHLKITEAMVKRQVNILDVKAKVHILYTVVSHE